MRAARTLTFLFTDVEDSSRQWEERPATMGSALERHDAVIAAAVDAHGGTVFKHTGDGMDAVFPAAAEAVAAAVEAQRGLLADGWKVRIALHSGAAEERDGDFFGPVLNRCGRLRDAAHGGQILCSEATADLARDDLSADLLLNELGLFRLRGLSRPEVVYQVNAEGLVETFPQLRVESLSNLPVITTSFIGRDDELDQIQKALTGQRLVTVVGMGGVGKTRLAVEAASRVSDPAGTVWYVDLASVPDDGLLGSALAQVVGVPIGDSVTSLLDQSVRSLERRRGLVVLDNCEHLISACAELCMSILTRCPNVRVLTTSREVLNVDGEAAISIGPLNGSGDGTDIPAAVRLFEDRAAFVRSGFRVDAANQPIIEEICQRLDGLPLAIELAAARVVHLSPRQIADRLDDRFRLLTGPRKSIGRQQTLEAAMDWSYNLLSEEERRLLRLLALFLAPFRLEVVEGMSDGRDVVDLLGSLVAKSLVVADLDADPPRYRLLETVRTYSWRRLVEADEVSEARTRHRDSLLADTEAPARDRAWLSTTIAEQLLEEYPDIVAAMDWTRERRELVILARLVAASAAVWLWSTHFHAVREPLDVVLAEAELEPELRAECLALRSHVALMLAEPDVLAIARRATDAPDQPDNRGLAWAWAVRAIVESSIASDSVSAARAWHCIEENRRIRQSLGGVWSSWPWGELLARVQLGDLDGVVPVAEAGLHGIPDRVEYWNLEASLRAVLAAVLHIRGRDHEAAAAARPVLDDLRAGRHGFGERWFFFPSSIAIAFALDGDPDRARGLCRTAAELVGTSPVPLVAGDVLLGLACLAVIDGDIEKGSRLLSALIESGRRSGYAFVLRSPVSGAIYRHYVGIVRARLDAARARQVREEGQRMSLEQALSYALM